MGDHSASGVDAGTWNAPLISGISAGTWSRLAWGSFAVASIGALAAIIVNVVAPQDASIWSGSAIPVVLLVALVCGGGFATVGFVRTFRQADREISAGYTTLPWRSLRGSVPIVDVKTRRVAMAGSPPFDPDVARAHAPWSTDHREGAIELRTPASVSRAAQRARWAGLVAVVLLGLGLVARAQAGDVSNATVLAVGAVIVVVCVVVLSIATIGLRLVLLRRVATVADVTGGVVVGAISATDIGAAVEQLAQGRIPRLSALVFDARGVSVWRDASGPLATISLRDIVALRRTLIVSGRTLTQGISLGVIPAGGRWPIALDFTILDPARPLAAMSQEKLDSLVTSVTRSWTEAASR